MENLIKEIVKEAKILKDKYTNQINAPVNYACVFCQSAEEYADFLKETGKIGKIVEQRPNSFLFKISPVETVAGKVALFRVRQPDKEKLERGDADFTVSDYSVFKEKYLKEPGFILIPRNGSEMIELSKEGEKIRVYFSAPELIASLSIL